MVRLSSLAVLIAATIASTAIQALPHGQRSVSFDHDGPTVYLDERGELDGDLFEGSNGAEIPNARVLLHSKRQNPAFNYASTKVRGVNIGGWLVAEPWITPSLFDDTGDSRVIDEYTFGKYVGDVGERLEEHWDSFYSESDFSQIAAAGLNHVRIPIGFWAIDSNHGVYYQGSQLQHLKTAVGWARSHGLKVLIDLHGAPHSQNGFDNSGRKGTPNWFTDENYKNRAKAVIQTLANTFRSDSDTVTAIELLNEPLTTSGPPNALSFTQDYYVNAYYAARYPSGSQITDYAVVIHDGFQPLTTWANQLQPPTFQQVILDTHIYYVFDNTIVGLGKQDKLNQVCGKRSSIAQSQNHLYTIVGEWTAAPTDCAKYLNGRGVGARYDGTFPGSTYHGSCNGKTGDGSNFSSAYKNYLASMFDTQRSVYEAGSGWVFWTWKTEQAADWDYQRGLRLGYITNNLNQKGLASC